jgi:7-carboxy-7-deazaguanine synthase
MKINLVKGGIFPIKGNTDDSSTGYGVAGTFQGEGKLLGTPCLFIRTSGCNLRCSWVGGDGNGSPCDTPYSSHNPEKNMMEIEDIISIVNENARPQNIKYVVVSGGEPTLQTKELGELLKRLQEEGYHTTVETNATIFDQDIADNIDLISMSPKLSSSSPWEANLLNTGFEFNQKWAERHERDRKNLVTIQQYINSCYYVSDGGYDRWRDFQLKFVISKPEDIVEIENDFLNHLRAWYPDDICLMPEGVTAEDLMTKTKWVAEEALKRGWRFTPRLHVLMFGKNRFV